MRITIDLPTEAQATGGVQPEVSFAGAEGASGQSGTGGAVDAGGPSEGLVAALGGDAPLVMTPETGVDAGPNVVRMDGGDSGDAGGPPAVLLQAVADSDSRPDQQP